MLTNKKMVQSDIDAFFLNNVRKEENIYRTDLATSGVNSSLHHSKSRMFMVDCVNSCLDCANSTHSSLLFVGLPCHLQTIWAWPEELASWLPACNKTHILESAF